LLKHAVQGVADAGAQVEEIVLNKMMASGKKIFDGSLLSVRYFFDVLDAELWKSLLYRRLDFEGDVLKHPEYLEEAYETGKALVNVLKLTLKETF